MIVPDFVAICGTPNTVRTVFTTGPARTASVSAPSHLSNKKKAEENAVVSVVCCNSKQLPAKYRMKRLVAPGR